MSHKLLLADDSVTIQRVIELTFADEDVQVIAVGDGRQAIERIESDRPDIVLADVGMPERDGYDVAAFVKNTPHLAHIPVLLLTGAFEPVDEQRASAVGCDGVLAKPFEPHMVITRVKELLAEAPRPRAAVTPPSRPAPEPFRPEDVNPELPPTQPMIPLPPEMRAPAPAAVSEAASVPVEALPIPESRLKTADLEVVQPLPSGEPTPDLAAQAVIAEPAEPAVAPSPGDSPLDAAVRINRRTPIAVPGFGTPPPQAAPTGASLDDYFDRLDAAFASLHPSPPLAAGRDDVASDGSPAAGKPNLRDEGAAVPADAGHSAAAPPVLAQAFSALFAAEHRETGEPAIPAFYAAPAAPQVSTDELVERVTEQVLQRLTDRVVRETVTDIVSRVAERLVRDEIERVRSTIK
jgi:CheY-like chemotaxis protein